MLARHQLAVARHAEAEDQLTHAWRETRKESGRPALDNRQPFRRGKLPLNYIVWCFLVMIRAGKAVHRPIKLT